MPGNNNNELPRTRAEAKAVGSKRYFTGVACVNNHLSARTTSSGGCLACVRERKQKKYQDNPDLVLERNRKRRESRNDKDRERDRLRSKERYARNPEAYRVYLREWRARNAEKERARGRAKYRRMKEENPEAILASGRRRDVKIRSSPKGRLDNAISTGVHRGMTKGAKAGRGTFDLLGYSLTSLTDHLEKQFLPGMTWENYGRGGWHIDHVIPRSAFNYETPDDIDFKRCWALDNLQPLWEFDNMSKGAKLDQPFQPSLALAANDNSPATHAQAA